MTYLTEIEAAVAESPRADLSLDAWLDVTSRADRMIRDLEASERWEQHCADLDRADDLMQGR